MNARSRTADAASRRSVAIVRTVAAEAPTVESHGVREWSVWRRPPGLIFHLAMAVGALLALFALSVPLASFAPSSFAVLILVPGAVIWTARAVTHLVARNHGRALGHTFWLAVAPIGAVLTLAIAAADLPLRARWALSRDAFEDAVAEVQRDPDDEFDWDRRIGLYDIGHTWKEGDAILFTEATGGFLLTSGGFASPRWPRRRRHRRQPRLPAPGRPLVRLDLMGVADGHVPLVDRSPLVDEAGDRGGAGPRARCSPLAGSDRARS